MMQPKPWLTVPSRFQLRRKRMKGLVGKKVGMSQIFDDAGKALPVTLIEAGPCYVTQVRSPKRDGYRAVQIGFGEVKPRRISGGQLGHLKRNDLPPLRYLREFRVKKLEGVKEGDKLTVEVFTVGDRVDVVGTSKGKGFAGAIKRHGFRRQPKTHGQSDRTRAPGSHGATSTPGRVFKGSRGPGHMGNARVTSQNVKVVWIDTERNLIGVSGSVPGPKGGVVMIKEARKQ
jgi:large subunit ribosomal protein L3